MYTNTKHKPKKNPDLEQLLLERKDRFKILNDGRVIVDLQSPSVQADFNRLFRKLENVEV